MDATRLPLRSVLFAPGNDRRKIAKALGLGASLVMLDLEDAVAAGEKAAARATVCETLQTAPVDSAPLGVRINALASGLAEADLDALAEQLPRIALITIPMAEGPDEVRHVAARLDELERDAGGAPTALLVMAETARGILAAREIAEASERVRTLLFGPADLGRELGVEPTAEGFEHLHARSALVLAARAAGREAPSTARISSSTTTRAAPSRRRGRAASASRARSPCTRASCRSSPPRSRPGERELAWAREVDRAFRESEADGVSSLKLADGTFVDYAVVARARALLRAAEG